MTDMGDVIEFDREIWDYYDDPIEDYDVDIEEDIDIESEDEEVEEVSTVEYTGDYKFSKYITAAIVCGGEAWCDLWEDHTDHTKLSDVDPEFPLWVSLMEYEENLNLQSCLSFGD